MILLPTVYIHIYIYNYIYIDIIHIYIDYINQVIHNH